MSGLVLSRLKEEWSGSPDVFWVDPNSLELEYCRRADYDAVHMANVDCLLFYQVWKLDPQTTMGYSDWKCIISVHLTKAVQQLITGAQLFQNFACTI